MLNPKTNANKAGAIGLVSAKYDDQIHSTSNREIQSADASISLAVKNLIANKIEEYIFTSLTRMTAKKGKRKVQGMPQSQTAALPRPQEEEETDKSKQAQTEQTYEKH